MNLPPEAAAVRASSAGLTENVELQIATIAELRNVMRAIMAGNGAKRHQLPPPIVMPERPKPPRAKGEKPPPLRDQLLEAFGPPRPRTPKEVIV